MPLSKDDIGDLEIVDATELGSDGTIEYNSGVTVVSTTSSNKRVVFSGVNLLYDPDERAQSGDIVILSGTSGGSGDGTFTIDNVIDETTIDVVETIGDSTGGSANFRHPPGAGRVGFDSTGLTQTTADNVQDAVSDLDGAISECYIAGPSKCFFWDDFLSNSLDENWDIDIVGSSSATLPDNAIGGQARLRSGSVYDDHVSIFNHDNYSAAANAKFSFRLKIEDTANSYVFLGGAGPYSAWFERWGSYNWYAKSDDSGGEESTDLGFAANSSWHEYAIFLSSSQVLFYYDGSLVATHTTRIPPSYLGPYVYISTTSAGSEQDAYVDWVKASGDRES
jgi:hypothetical protein